MMGNHKRVIMATGVWVAVFSACWAAEEGRRVTVPDDYLTITEAVDKADPNDIIFIRNGTYNEDFSIKIPLTLEGESRDGVIIRAPADKYAVIYVKKHPVTFKNLTVEHSDQNTEKQNTSCLRIEKSASTVENCLFRNTVSYGVIVKYNCRATINNCIFENNKSCGIHVFDNYDAPVITNNILRKNGIGISLRQCNGFVENNSFEGNHEGMSVGEFKAPLMVRSNTFADDHIGIWIWNEKQPQKDSLSFAEVWAELDMSTEKPQTEKIVKRYTEVFGQRWPVVENNIISNSKTCGFLIEGTKAVALLRHNQCKNGLSGYIVRNGAQVLVTDCKAEENKEDGFLIWGDSTFIIMLNNHAFKNIKRGIIFNGNTHGRVIGNVVENNRDIGICANDVEGDILIAHNKVCHNDRFGLLFLSNKPDWRVEYNTFNHNDGEGICVNNTRQNGIVRHNTCNGNKSGIWVNYSTKIQVEENACSNNEEYGIIVQERSNAELRNNVLEGNGWTGIFATEMGAHCDVYNNRIIDNHDCGIMFRQQAEGRIEGNICSGHSWAGIALRDVGLEAVVAGNTCNDNGAWGIISYAGAEPVMQDDNVAENNGRGGIKHRPLAPEEKVAAWIHQGRAYVEVKNHLGAIECFRQALAFVPEHTEALRLLGWACYEEGLKRSGKTASDNFDNAYKAFQQALSTAPHDLQSLYGLAAVMERRTIADDEQKIQTQQDVTQIFEKSLQASPRSLDRITLYSIHNISQANKAQKESALPFLEKTQAVLLQTLLCRKDNAELLSCLGMLYINYSYIVSDKKEDYLQKAEECLTRIDSGGLKTTSGAYNLACVYALQGKEEKCREYLVIAQDNGQLPSREHVMQDRDLASVRKKPWFRELKWPQDEKEPEQLEIPKDF